MLQNFAHKKNIKSLNYIRQMPPNIFTSLRICVDKYNKFERLAQMDGCYAWLRNRIRIRNSAYARNVLSMITLNRGNDNIKEKH